MNAEKSSKRGVAILFVGVMIGLGIGIAACVTTMAHSTPAIATSTTASHSSAEPLPSLLPPPPQTASLAPAPEPVEQAAPTQQIAQTVSYQQTQAQGYQQSSPYAGNLAPPNAVAPNNGPQSIALQSQDGTLLMPGVNAFDTTPTLIDTTPTVITAGSINPNWTVGRNGLLENPCVDPPSAHGRQTGQY